MIITKDWIHAHKTPAGAWNSSQLKALGIKWPAKKGWQNGLVGTEITDAQQQAFESHATSKPKLSKIESMELRLSALEKIVKQLTS